MKKILFTLIILLHSIFSISCDEVFEIGFTGSPHSLEVFKNRVVEINADNTLGSILYKPYASTHYTLDEFKSRITEFQNNSRTYNIPRDFTTSFIASSHDLQTFYQRMIFINSKLNEIEPQFVLAYLRSNHSYDVFKRRINEVKNNNIIDPQYHPNYVTSFYTIPDFIKRIELFEKDPLLTGTEWF